MEEEEGVEEEEELVEEGFEVTTSQSKTGTEKESEKKKYFISLGI